ncbi:MAG: DUF4835 family protein [Ignavibacteria bacterium]|jgi:hypothetical protein
MRTFIFSLIFFSLQFLPILHAQEIELQVNVDLQNISFDNRIDIQNLKQDIVNYINNQRYSEQEWDKPKVPVDIGITITSRGGNNTYSGILTIMAYTVLENGSRSILMRAMDKQWTFEYAPGNMMTFQANRFNALSSPIDFYMLMAIGMFLDTFGELDGTPYYEKAKVICRAGAGANATGYPVTPDPSVPSKLGLSTEASDLLYEEFRKLIFSYHFDGLETINKDKSQGLQLLATIIEQMSQFKKSKVTMRSQFMESFFNSKFQELADLFKGYQDPEVFNNLSQLDPANSSVYQSAKENR